MPIAENMGDSIASDLIERLREPVGDSFTLDPTFDLRHEAAEALSQLTREVDELREAVAKQRQALDTAIIHKLETQTHGGLTEFGEGGLAALRTVERVFNDIDEALSRSSGRVSDATE